MGPRSKRFGPYGSKKAENFSVKLGEGERFSQIMLYHGWMLDGILFWITKPDGTTSGPIKLGGYGGDCFKIILKEDEYLTRISGKHGYDIPRCHEAIASLKIHTNLCSEGYGPFGLAKDVDVAHHFESSFLGDDPVVEVFGRGGNQVESIGIVVTKRQEIEWCGPYGSQLAANYEMQLQDEEFIKEVIVRHGFIVDSIGFVIRKLGGIVSTKHFGGNAGEESKIVLKDDEYLTYFSGISGYHKSHKMFVVATLKIHTNKCLKGYGPYGLSKEVEKCRDFSSPILAQGNIVGVFGRHNNYLESIGVITEKEQLIESYGPYGSQSPQNFCLQLKDGERIIAIKLSHGWIINKIGFVISKPGKLTSTVMFGGDGEVDSEITLADREYLTRISGTYRNDKTQEIASLKIHTNLWPAGYGPYGPESNVEIGSDFSSPYLVDGPIVGIFGRSNNNNLESIGVFLQKGLVIESYGPYGSSLQQNYVMQLKDGERISEVIITHNNFVNAIGFVATKPNNGCRSIGVIYNGKDNENTKIVLEEGEYLTRISGTYGNYEEEKIDLIATLKIHTNFCPVGYGPFGHFDKIVDTKRDFSSPLLNASPIIGVFGRINNYIESIGVLLKRELLPINYGCS